MATVTHIKMFDFEKKDTHLSFMPLAHIFERLLTFFTIYYGGKLCFYGGNLANIKEDI